MYACWHYFDPLLVSQGPQGKTSSIWWQKIQPNWTERPRSSTMTGFHWRWGRSFSRAGRRKDWPRKTSRLWVNSSLVLTHTEKEKTSPPSCTWCCMLCFYCNKRIANFSFRKLTRNLKLSLTMRLGKRYPITRWWAKLRELLVSTTFDSCYGKEKYIYIFNMSVLLVIYFSCQVENCVGGKLANPWSQSPNRNEYKASKSALPKTISDPPALNSPLPCPGLISTWSCPRTWCSTASQVFTNQSSETPWPCKRTWLNASQTWKWVNLFFTRVCLRFWHDKIQPSDCGKSLKRGIVFHDEQVWL